MFDSRHWMYGLWLLCKAKCRWKTVENLCTSWAHGQILNEKWVLKVIEHFGLLRHYILAARQHRHSHRFHLFYTRSALTHFLLYYTNKFDNKIQRSSLLLLLLSSSSYSRRVRKHFTTANSHSQNDLNNMHSTKFVSFRQMRIKCLSGIQHGGEKKKKDYSRAHYND